MRLSKLLEMTGYSTEENDDVEITEIVTDSTKASHNSMFICLSGLEHDGHKHITEALLRGAACVVIQRGVPCDIPDFRKRVKIVVCDNTRLCAAKMYSAWYGEPSKKLKMIAVTGTNGKTSVTVMLKAIFEAEFYKCGIIGTMACYSGKRRLVDGNDSPMANMTTPDPKQFYRMLAFMAADNVDYVFVEASSHALKLFKLDAVRFECGIFTNLGRDHMDFHKTTDDYLFSKTRLFDLCKRGIINADIDGSAAIIQKASESAETFSFSASDRTADFRATDVINEGVNGISYTFRSKNTVMKIKSPIPGGFTVENTLSAASCALIMGISPSTVQSALRSLSGVEGRVERLKTSEKINFSIFIDYAHTPEALESLLKSFRELRKPEGRIVLLFGCGGNRDRKKRGEMGKIASRLADKCIVTADNSRNEKTSDIINEIISGFDKSYDCELDVFENRREAIESAVKTAKCGDILILAGKGHEKYEIDQSGKHEFDEKNIVLETVKKYYG